MLNKNFAYYYGEMDKKYSASNGRWPTMKAALTLAQQFSRSSPILIAETGCQRELNDLGAGMSSAIFGDFCNEFGGHLTTIDNNPVHLERCRSYTAEYSKHISYVLSDSILGLEQIGRKLDLLYLDSYDYPIVEIGDLMGPREDFPHHLEILHDMGELAVVEKYKEMILPCQQHTVYELDAAVRGKCIGLDTVILIDDNALPGGGKSRLAKEWLIDKGWYCVLDSQQTLWIQR